jgi:hypothetical protein
MAKTATATLAETTPDLSSKVERAIDGIKKPFMSYVKDFTALAASREDLAPKFMKAFGLWQAETAGTFVDFVRMLVPEIGNSRNEYRNHRAYQAADYLRRLVGNANRRPRTQEERAAAPVAPTDALSRIMASLMTIIPEDQQQRIWTAMQSQLHWTDRQVNRLQTQVEHVDPLVQIQGRVQNLRLRFPAGAPETAQQTAVA